MCLERVVGKVPWLNCWMLLTALDSLSFQQTRTEASWWWMMISLFFVCCWVWGSTLSTWLSILVTEYQLGRTRKPSVNLSPETHTQCHKHISIPCLVLFKAGIRLHRSAVCRSILVLIESWKICFIRNQIAEFTCCKLSFICFQTGCFETATTATINFLFSCVKLSR